MLPTHLQEIAGATKLEDLSDDQALELQKALARLGHPVGAFDGMIGPKTRGAWAEFKHDAGMDEPGLIGPAGVKALLEALADAAEGHDFSTPEGTRAAIAAECRRQGIVLPDQIAYVLATVEHETNATYRPVTEAYYLHGGQIAYLKTLKYNPYYGRGYVQLTWKTNYQRYGDLLNVALVTEPDLALDPKVALFVLVHGFKTGAFTGKKIADYIHDHHTDFFNARRCINGVDKAQHIADLAHRQRTNLPA